MITVTQAANAGSFILPQWVITPLPGENKWLFVLSGSVLINFTVGPQPGWRKDTVEIYPDLASPLGYAMQSAPPVGVHYIFNTEQYAAYGGLGSIFDADKSVNAGFAIDAFRPLFDGATRSLSGIAVDIAARDSDAQILQVNYQFTAVGSIVSEIVPREAVEQPWAILACRFSDDADPANVLLRDLPGITVSPTDNQTALQLFETFFTSATTGTSNVVHYFSDMSHGAVDISGSEVFVVNIDMTKAQMDAYQNGGISQQALEAQFTQTVQTAALKQGVPLQNFYGLVVTSHYPLNFAQGGGVAGGAQKPNLIGWAGMDYRWIKNNGTQSWGHEMGHGFGLAHSCADGLVDQNGQPLEYKDPIDIMSARAVYSAPDPDYTVKGPGVNAWNMRCRGWLDESRVWHCPSGGFFDLTIDLRPLHRRDLPGYLSAELPPMNDNGGFPRFLVEYRIAQAWDAAIPQSYVLIHHLEGTVGQFMGARSFICEGTDGQYFLVEGDQFTWGPTSGMTSGLQVVKIDDANRTATVRLTNM